MLLYLKIKKKVKDFYKWIIELDIDVIFVYLFTYIILPNLNQTTRVLGSIGLCYVYKMIMKDIQRAIIIRGRTK